MTLLLIIPTFLCHTERSEVSKPLLAIVKDYWEVGV